MIFVYIFIGLIVVLLVVAAFLPKTYHIEKTMIIKKPVTEVMNRVANLNEYAAWNPWQQSDRTATKTISGSAGTPGHQYSWKGKKVGMGTLTLTDLDERHLHFALTFLKPWKATAKDNWLFEAWGEGETKVTWENSGGLPWPMARLMGPLLNKNLNHQFEQGLNNLKKLCGG
jgi:hypothetical protein